MKILLLCTAFNSQTQAVYTWLQDRGYQVIVSYAISDVQMLEEIESVSPDLILCPFLKRYLPESIYAHTPTYIFHPGPLGDRGPNALEYALQSHTKTWGLVILRANALYDGGDIYAQEDFKVRDTYKASLYRQEIVQASLQAMGQFFKKLKNNEGIPQLLNPIHAQFTQAKRAIDWSIDSTDTIIEKIYLSDSLPGVLDELFGIPCYLYGAHKEDNFRGKPKEILAKRNGAICLGTRDGAVWISHLKKVGSFKLPATYVLKDKLEGIKEERLPLIFDKSYNTFYEISVDKRDSVAYLYFNFHNGAMSAEQCIRLKYAVEYLKTECEVLVLMGGMDFFSNGIHLNILEDSQKPGEDGWSNINAMNDLVHSILYADEIVTVASFGRNAGAGGVFMGLACDYVVAKEGVVLNPHYKTLGLSGSEYHTYSLPKRVGEEIAEELLEICLPISSVKAKALGMVDEVYADKNYYEDLHQFAKTLYDDDFIWSKQEYLEKNGSKIEALKEKELEVMHPEFWEHESAFHTLRQEFVYKICPRETPARLKVKSTKEKVYA
ncbi:enoyl-CoA hydratase-related protein [Sulfurovum sp. XGS-02]|uniref:enoyl-CoA hydratase-related protein n=1 Tax=Sulfurovum sp. XGS-02 TaxID=2925411 RepID=UPI0020638751|nr:enoyl-CoA hydratase-related protein [Sulfurovum sp. XGS-02]UPT77902.1 enoyl-CoA hydratase-related protein [Sulfurovum sp. XGS-02]